MRGLGCYGETATSRMLRPNRLRQNTHPGLSCASYLYDPRPVQCCLHELSQKGTSAPELCSAASNLPVMRFPRRGGDAPQQPLRRGSFAPSSCSMLTRYIRARSVWRVKPSGGVPCNNKSSAAYKYFYKTCILIRPFIPQQRMQPRCCAPHRALWAAPTGWDTEYDGDMRWGCWRAGWGAAKNGRRAVQTERRETRTMASVLRVTARAARCYKGSTRTGAARAPSSLHHRSVSL